MAAIKQVTIKDEHEWKKWAEGRPAIIRELASKFRPWRLYRLVTSGYRVVPYSFNEDGTLTVVVSGKFNLVKFEHRVFGVNPNDLVECELPGKDEELGVQMDAKQTIQWVNRQRALLGVAPMTQDQLDAITRNGQCALSGELPDIDDLPAIGAGHGHPEMP